MLTLTEAQYPNSIKDTYLKQYCDAISAGEIIAGQELTSLLSRLITELSDDSKYIYDTIEAHFRIEFIETFCKHSKKPFYGKPFILELWEKAFIEVIYSYLGPDGFRRFKKVILLIARKNGKSTLCAAIAFTELMLGEGGSDIVCSSNDDPQADIIYQEINNMRRMFDRKNRRTIKNQRWIKNKFNDSRIYKLSDRTKNKEGRNVALAVLDESHEMKNNVIAVSIEQSQSTLDDPLFINISSEGFVNDGYLDEETAYARKVNNGEHEDKSLLAWFYTQDSEAEVWQEPASRQKSNPNLGITKKINYIERQITKAQEVKSHKIFVLAKDFNIKQNNVSAWFSRDEVQNENVYDIKDFAGCICLGAVDLSETTDLTVAKILMMRKGDTQKYIYQKYFIPEAKADRKEDRVDYMEWARKGLLDIHPGNEVDQGKVADWFVKKVYKELKIRFWKIGYDKWYSADFVRCMERYGFSGGYDEADTLERVGMNRYVLSTPMRMYEADIKGKLINSNQNPIDMWCTENTSIKVFGDGLMMPVKVNDEANRRIDGCVADIILETIFNRHRTEFLALLK